MPTRRSILLTAAVSAAASAAVLVPLRAAFADAYTQQFTVVSGPYYPYWFADTCLTAYIASGSHDNYGSIYSSVDPGQCAGTAADMAAQWQGIMLSGYEDGYWCGFTQWYLNSSAGSGFWVGPVDLCGQPSGTHNYVTETSGEVWSDVNGSYQYISAGSVYSPPQS
ncbi:MAG TPA: hypothetical protein VKV25_02510 [Acidimicrobiales bacterium]|nr:hypothetical protein [Acidimicrobiales bacterium]